MKSNSSSLCVHGNSWGSNRGSLHLYCPRSHWALAWRPAIKINPKRTLDFSPPSTSPTSPPPWQPVDATVDVTKCAFWEYETDNLQGHWATHGCKTLNVNSSATTCSCNHLTHFAILMSSGRANVSRPTLRKCCVSRDKSVAWKTAHVRAIISTDYWCRRFILSAYLLRSDWVHADFQLN